MSVIAESRTQNRYRHLFGQSLLLDSRPIFCYGPRIGTTPTQIRVSPMVYRVSKVDGAE